MSHGAGGHIATREIEELQRILIETVRDYAIFALDPAGHVLSWNPGAERFKGYTASEIIGQHFSIFYPPEDIASGKPDWELEVAAEVGRFEDEGWRLRKDGSRFWANVIITALRDETGELVGFGKVTRDLTERRRAEERAVEDARRVAQAEASNRAKSEFLTALSHELRTPLNAIGGYAELLALGVHGEVTPAQRDALARIRRSQHHLLVLINDLLNYSRLEAGQIHYEIAPTSVKTMVDAVVDMVAPQLAMKGLALECEPCAPEVEVLVDRTKVEQILINLLSNAVKFTPEGRIAIRCAVADDRAELRVSDTGPGIPRDKREAIFEPFVQLGRSLTSGPEGTGLGLAISRDLARAMGGELSVEDSAEPGATFVLRLPRAAGG
ncbi:MAG TPA: PAS domain-containing sensor histidine kinase [Gemmatimonadaceae bacterium]|nr:PAS domain-containing sensor histidine kinase [Gemmatimonadaceae bacterium]